MSGRSSDIGAGSATLARGRPSRPRHPRGRSRASHVTLKDYCDKRNSPNNIILKQKVEELIISNSARNKRQTLDRSVLSKGRLITMDDVVRICQAEAQRKDKEAERKDKQEAKKKKSEEQLEIPDSQELGPQVSTAVGKPWEEWSSIIQF